MRLVVNTLEPVHRYVRIELRGRQALVPEKLLDRAKVRAPVQQVRGKRVPEKVRAFLRDIRNKSDILARDPVHRSRIDAFACRCQKERLRTPGACEEFVPAAEIAADGLFRPASERDDSLLASLPPHLHRIVSHIDAAPIE